MTALADELATLVHKLQAQRQGHLDAIKEIDDAFAQLGLSVDNLATNNSVGRPKAKRGPGRPRGSKSSPTTKTRRRRGRGSYDQTSEEFVISLFQGGKTLQTSEVNKLWKQAGRGGTADNTLSKLARSGRLVRESIEGKRGSEYHLPQ